MYNNNIVTFRIGLMNMNTTNLQTVCFDKSELQVYIVLIVCIVAITIYLWTQTTENMANVQLHTTLSNKELLDRIRSLQDDLYDCTTSKQRCERQLSEMQSTKQTTLPTTFLNRIYNPLVPPERSYVGRKMMSSRDQYDQYQPVGFIYNTTDRYPLFARPKYPGKTDKYEYYIIDETRNRLKIPFRSRNDNELFDNDTIFIDVLNSEFTVKIYEYEGFRYNPDL